MNKRTMYKRTWLTVLLVVSIGTNLVFVGVIIGRHVFGMPPGRPHLDWMTQAVSDETRTKIRTSMREHKQATRPARRELRGAQTKLHDAITARDYVEAEVIQGLSEVRQATATLQKSMHEQIVHNLRHLDPDERVQVFSLMTRRGRMRPHEPPRPHEGKPDSMTQD